MFLRKTLKPLHVFLCSFHCGRCISLDWLRSMTIRMNKLINLFLYTFMLKLLLDEVSEILKYNDQLLYWISCGLRCREFQMEMQFSNKGIICEWPWVLEFPHPLYYFVICEMNFRFKCINSSLRFIEQKKVSTNGFVWGRRVFEKCHIPN